MQFNRKVHANNPALTTDTVVAELAFTGVGGSPLRAAIAPSINADAIVGILFTPTADLRIRNATGANGSGILITSGNTLYLPVVGWPTGGVELEYESAVVVPAMLFTRAFPSVA